jgi:phosphoribosylamine---glycine ligase
MKVLVIGSGGREHALVWKLNQSKQVKEIFCAPGNGGIEQMARCVNLSSDDIAGLCRFALDEKIDLTVVGPEAPLVNGIVDVFEREGLRIFGPDQKAAQLEGSKVFAKEFMWRHGIPTAEFRNFKDIDQAKEYARQRKFPLVVKADGLAAGKGVVICQHIQEAYDALDQIMRDKIFHSAGDSVIIEECLVGEEVSILAIIDGKQFVLLDSSQDHKRIFDQDLGPNTGGMGAYSPAPVMTQKILVSVALNILAPTIQGMKEEGMPFKGVLYAGLMITEQGPKVLEYNVRFGDPETQAVLPRLKSDLVEILLAASEGHLKKMELSWDRRPCVCVVMSSRGYPGVYEKGKTIHGLEDIYQEPDTVVFHAGTKRVLTEIQSAGGRVLGVTSLGKDIEQAMDRAYQSVEKISFDGCFFRRDIGAKALRSAKKIT